MGQVMEAGTPQDVAGILVGRNGVIKVVVQRVEKWVEPRCLKNQSTMVSPIWFHRPWEA